MFNFVYSQSVALYLGPPREVHSFVVNHWKASGPETIRCPLHFKTGDMRPTQTSRKVQLSGPAKPPAQDNQGGTEQKGACIYPPAGACCQYSAVFKGVWEKITLFNSKPQMNICYFSGFNLFCSHFFLLCVYIVLAPIQAGLSLNGVHSTTSCGVWHSGLPFLRMNFPFLRLELDKTIHWLSTPRPGCGPATRGYQDLEKSASV